MKLLVKEKPEYNEIKFTIESEIKLMYFLEIFKWLVYANGRLYYI